jgi:CheY-like chemotaxis protein
LLQSVHVPKKKSARNSRSSESQLGNAVRICRAHLGITQEELAWRASMHRSYIADIERGGRNITLRSITALAKALQIPVERLLSNPQGEIELGEILLVEDNAADAELVLRSFRRAHVANPVRIAGDGDEALEILFGSGRVAKTKAPRPQLILLDLKLPTLSGVEVLRQIKADTRTRDIPVVVLTASRHDAAIIECGRLGAENYILKPVNFENLSKLTSVMKLRWALIPPAETPVEAPK